jgi:type I restriction enzyme S subunit
MIKSNSVLIALTGATCANIGFLTFPSTANQSIVAIENSKVLFPKFLFYFLLAQKNQILIERTGGAQSGINEEVVKNLRIYLPPLSEQTAIANFLDEKTAKIDSLIEKKKKLIELYKEERTAVINHYVLGQHLLIDNGQLTIDNSQLSIMNYKLPPHWEVKKLKYVAKVNPSTKSFSFQKDSNDEVVFLPMEKVSEDGSINQEIKKQISEISSGFTYFERGDIILAKITPCFENGKSAMLNDLETEFGFGSTEFHTLRSSDKILKEYLFLILKTQRFMKIGEVFMTGAAGQKRLPTDYVKEFKLPIPPITEQHQIVEHIEAETKRIDEKIVRTEKEIELLQEYRTALISEVVTGKIKVVDD